MSSPPPVVALSLMLAFTFLLSSLSLFRKQFLNASFSPQDRLFPCQKEASPSPCEGYWASTAQLFLKHDHELGYVDNIS